ncbi:AraC family transcriptional regulator [Pseudomonas abietaniphila]|uniref:AraC-type DNA-binding protein n=1 Tax=Pseudomonas abietaniphila TaxID=89065 RepID=A0A1G7RNH5_9PSED|nr:helix-turn-helix transcriptional regulator [Pseudomonas abietaniphila]SDG12316.1 AraC-type DNA-binding protein [Pseudomonas abietaniphila]
MEREVRTAAVCVTQTGRSEDYLDYRDVTRPMTVLVRNQQTGAFNAPHTHRHGQVLYACAGVMRVSAQNGLWYLPPRRALWIPAGVVHDQLMLSPVKLRSVYIDPQACGVFGPMCKVVEVSVMLRELILALADQPVEYPQNSRNAHIVALILSELERSRSLPVQIPWPVDRRLAVVCEAILARPENAQSVEYWADKVGASSRTLIRLFLKETGLTFRHWVQQVRLATALDRLEQGQSVGVIARDLGYTSASAFSAMFRRVMGESPREFLMPGR